MSSETEFVLKTLHWRNRGFLNRLVWAGGEGKIFYNLPIPTVVAQEREAIAPEAGRKPTVLKVAPGGAEGRTGDIARSDGEVGGEAAPLFNRVNNA